MLWEWNHSTDNIAGQTTVVAAPTVSKVVAIGSSSEVRYYNPLPYPVTVKRMYGVIKENTLSDNVTVTLYRNDLPTEYEMFAAGSYTGSIVYEQTEIILHPGDWIQFRINTGTIPLGEIGFYNLSLLLKRNEV
jgi:hypothetical protein